jgi:predicted RNA-binding protein with RPS1 domain
MSVVPKVEGFEGEQDALVDGTELTGRVQRIERFGVFVWLGPGRVGLIPTAWSGVPQGTRLESRFSVAQEIEVKVVEVADDGRKIRLTMKGVEPRPETGDGGRDSTRRRKPSKSGVDRGEEKPDAAAVNEDEGGFGTSLGDVLRAALKDKGE